MQIFIDHPDQLLKQVWNDKNIHIVEKDQVLGQDKFCLIDISMRADGQEEDKFFIDSPFYRANIRRGNTLVEINSKGKKKIIWGRKGTQKIIDIRLQYLRSVTKGLQLNKEEKKHFQYIFGNANKCFQIGKRVELIKTQKVNGQNAQVSYLYQFDSWIICSKNVSMVVRQLKDLQLYQGKRYAYAKVIAKQWFKQIQKINKQQLKKLKKFLDGFTLVGQYCGHPEHQHLILYNQIRIIWFALIDNFTEDYCVDPFQVKKDLEQFGFRFIRLKRLGSWSDKKKFFQQMEQVFIRIAEAAIEDLQYGMQGSIMYFVSPQIKDKKPFTRVLGSGKLKTIEYRYFRKIRQKLARYLYRKQAESQLIRRYERQCQQLQKSNSSSAPYPQAYYTQILKKGCELIREVKFNEEFLRTRFVSILKMLFYVINKNINLKTFGKKIIKNENFLKEVTNIPFSTYKTMGISTKIVFVPVELPYLSEGKIINELKEQFSQLSLPLKILKFQDVDIDKILTEINSSDSYQQNVPFLIHLYLQNPLLPEQMIKLASKLKYGTKKNIYHRMVVVTEKISPQEFFTDINHYEYPFTIQSILRSYYKGFSQVKSTPTIQQKIDELKKTTEMLKNNRDLSKTIQKSGIKIFQLKTFGDAKIGETQKNQLNKIVSSILSQQNEYENYCRLIVKLQKYSGEQFSSKNSSQISSQVKNLIKSNFASVPEIDFTQNT